MCREEEGVPPMPPAPPVARAHARRKDQASWEGGEAACEGSTCIAVVPVTPTAVYDATMMARKSSMAPSMPISRRVTGLGANRPRAAYPDGL